MVFEQKDEIASGWLLEEIFEMENLWGPSDFTCKEHV